MALLNWACDPNLMSTISQLTWDSKHKVVILPAVAELGGDLDDVENKPWMQHMTLSSGASSMPTKQYNDPDHAFPLSSDISVMTIHAQKMGDTNTPPSTPPKAPPTQSPSKEVVIIDPNTQDDVSTLSTMSKNELIKMLVHLHRNNQNLSGHTGFAPDREVSLHAGLNAAEAPWTGSPGTKGSPVAAAMGE